MEVQLQCGVVASEISPMAHEGNTFAAMFRAAIGSDKPSDIRKALDVDFKTAKTLVTSRRVPTRIKNLNAVLAHLNADLDDFYLRVAFDWNREAESELRYQIALHVRRMQMPELNQLLAALSTVPSEGDDEDDRARRDARVGFAKARRQTPSHNEGKTGEQQ